MTTTIAGTDAMQQIATVLRREQGVALELLVLGYSDSGVAKSLGVRRETLWRWKRRDPVFRTALDERRATVAAAAAERWRGLPDRAVSVVQTSLSAPEADPKPAMALLSAPGVLERSRALGHARGEPVLGARADTTEEDADVERMIEAVEAEAGTTERPLAAGGLLLWCWTPDSEGQKAIKLVQMFVNRRTRPIAHIVPSAGGTSSV